jgi:hypothetical protein
MANTENFIGQGVCPVCGSVKARFTVSKKQLACMACNTCNSQIFARSDYSDEKLRACIRTASPTAVVDTPPPARSAPPLAAPPDPAPSAPAAAKKGFGLLGAWS